MRQFFWLLATLPLAGVLCFTAGASAGQPTAPKKLVRLVVTAPTDEQIGKGVLKALGALVLHKASQPQADDEFLDAVARGVARAGRDKLIESALEDLFPDAKAVERASVRNLAILALDGRLPRDRARVLAQLKRTNPDMADAVQVAEFLIGLAKAVAKE